MVRRWKQANKIIKQAEADRIAAGHPEPEWHEIPFVVVMSALGISIIGAVALGGILRLTLDTVGALTGGILVIVLLGAYGHVLRGIGEHRQSKDLKAWGYYLGATAYLATASVALFNGVPHLLAE